MRTRNMMLGLLGGLAVISLIWMASRQPDEQPPAPQMAAVAAPTAAPTETASAHEEIATYRNEEFGFHFQYPVIVPWPCQYGGKEETCAIDMTPRDLSSIAVKDSVVFYLDARELSFSLFIEKKLPDFNDLNSFIQRENQDANEITKNLSGENLIIEDIRPLTWWKYTAFIVSERFSDSGEMLCSIYLEKEAFIYTILLKSSCSLLTSTDPENLDSEKDKIDEQKRKSAIRMTLKSFIFDNGGK